MYNDTVNIAVLFTSTDTKSCITYKTTTCLHSDVHPVYTCKAMYYEYLIFLHHFGAPLAQNSSLFRRGSVERLGISATPVGVDVDKSEDHLAVIQALT